MEVVWGKEGLGRTQEDKGRLKGLHCEDQGQGRAKRWTRAQVKAQSREVCVRVLVCMHAPAHTSSWNLS